MLGADARKHLCVSKSEFHLFAVFHIRTTKSKELAIIYLLTSVHFEELASSLINSPFKITFTSKQVNEIHLKPTALPIWQKDELFLVVNIYASHWRSWVHKNKGRCVISDFWTARPNRCHWNATQTDNCNRKRTTVARRLLYVFVCCV